MKLFIKQKQTHRKQLAVAKGERCWERDKLGVGVNIYILLYKIDHQQDPPYSTGNYTQYYVITYIRKESAKE